MATIINNPGGSSESSGVGMIVGVLLTIVLVVLFFVYALPALRSDRVEDAGEIDINLDVPDLTPENGNGNSSGGTSDEGAY